MIQQVFAKLSYYNIDYFDKEKSLECLSETDLKEVYLKEIYNNLAKIRTHNGIIIIRNLKTGGTFKVKMNTFKRTGDRFVYHSGRRIALLNESRLIPTRYATVEEKKVVNILNNQRKALLSCLVFEHDVRCRKCNRKLTNEESIKIGIGPICLEK